MTTFQEMAVSRHTGHVVGLTGRGPSGEPINGVAAQTDRIMTRLAELLARHNMDLSSVVRLRIFLTDINDWRQHVLAVVSTAFADVLPPCTVLEIAALVEPWMAIEVEVDVAMPGD
jgi:enamine deaminase RidA (YjgF/YER057c/UK114 family)